MNIYLIRHGKTQMNVYTNGKIFCGSTDIDVSKEGMEKIDQIPHNDVLKSIEKVYISNLVRTRQTADHLFGASFPKEVINEFAEVDFGIFEGKLYDEENPIVKTWIYDIKNCVFPNGDNVSKKAEKVYNKFLEIIKNENSENIAIVSHCSTIRLLLSRLLDNDISEYRKYTIDNGSITKLVYEDNKFSAEDINEEEFK